MGIRRRRDGDHEQPRAAGRTCPTCGAANPARLTICARCGRELIPAAEARALWQPASPASMTRNGADSVVIDLLPAGDPSLQATRPIDVTHRFGSLTTAASSASARSRGYGDAGSMPGQARAAGSLAPSARDRADNRPAGPGGWLLGLIACIIISAVAAPFGWSLVQPRVQAAVQAELDSVIATHVASLDPGQLRQGKRIVVTEDAINASIAAHASAYEPLSDVQVRITPERIVVEFSLYGVRSAFQGEPAVRRGRVEIANPALSGPARRVLDADELAQVLEEHLASLMTQARVRPTAVRLREGALAITTAST